MGLETGTYISDLVASNPPGGDDRSTADDHIRLIKSTILNTFPNVTGAVTPTHTELNYVDGVTSAIQTQLDARIVAAGKAGGQTVVGGTATGEDLDLESTAHATKGDVRIKDGEFLIRNTSDLTKALRLALSGITTGNTRTLTIPNASGTLTLLSLDQSWTGHQTFKELSETQYALSGTTPALDPANGTLQYWTLTANSTPTDSLTNGQSMTLMVNDGTAYTVTWPTMTWVGGSAPTLPTTGYAVIELWKVNGVLYGQHAGDA